MTLNNVLSTGFVILVALSYIASLIWGEVPPLIDTGPRHRPRSWYRRKRRAA